MERSGSNGSNDAGIWGFTPVCARGWAIGVFHKKTDQTPPGCPPGGGRGAMIMAEIVAGRSTKGSEDKQRSCKLRAQNLTFVRVLEQLRQKLALWTLDDYLDLLAGAP